MQDFEDIDRELGNDHDWSVSAFGRQGRWGAGALEDDSSCSTPPPALMPTDSEDEAEADSEDEAEAAVEAEAAAPFVVHAFRASGTRKPAE
ncbi:glycosyltransferase family 2 [Micractinium conductrix]|nr:glycosyltransferase family 2 [Micractinium conductrix]|eukprot:PSC74271.1 glycosyltransferase family 2 [Micractinium conductrix]